MATVAIYITCVRSSLMVPLVGIISTICINLITNGTIGNEIGANGKNAGDIGTNGTIGRTWNEHIIVLLQKDL